MKKKILMFSILFLTLTLVGNVYGANQGTANGGNETVGQVQQQTQIINQGETNQIQTQNSLQIQSGSTTGASVGVQVQQQTKIQNKDSTSTGSQVQNKEQVETKNQMGSTTSTQRRSEVANAVQEMLQVAERNGGIGQQVKVIAQNQTQNQEKIEASLEEAQSRGDFAKFFIGPKYSEINDAKELLAQNREEIKQLNQVKNQLMNQADQEKLLEQVQVIEEANLEIENSLDEAQKGFSLFGWAFRLFSR